PFISPSSPTLLFSCLPWAVLLQQSQSPPPVGAPAPGANACPPLSHRGRCSYNRTKPRPVGAPAPGANACPPVRTEAVLLRGPLQPHRIPMRIIPHRLHQPRPDRVGYDISGQRL